MMFHIRAEYPGTMHSDERHGGQTLEQARRSFEDAHPGLGPFDWRGAVCFCEGVKPAEERGRPLHRAALVAGRR